MRIKIRPVRWWRDDADRYRSRGAYVAAPATAPRWTLELIAGPNHLAEIQAVIDRAMIEAGAIPRSVWDSLCAPPDPIADVSLALALTIVDNVNRKR